MSQVVRTAVDKVEDPSVPRGPASGYVVGEVIADKYKLVNRLGEGGMGALWIARNLALDALVALKLIRTDIATEGAEERFLTEARAAARLKHPAITRVFDYGHTRKGDPFMVMELLQGETLGDVLDREGKLEAAWAIQALLPVADALAAAHSKGVVHRDLKPDNFFFADTDGRLQPKVLDFGIAKLEQPGVGHDHKITKAGTVVGSPDYMAPEQARGLDGVDSRADIWSFCVVVYECITGRVPFEDANYNALLRHIIEDDIRPILDFGVGDQELWAILAKGFVKDPARRYQGIRELGEDLAGWLISHGITEDICGQSLRAAWLEPQGANRTSRMSLPRISMPSLPVVRVSSESAPTIEAEAASPTEPAPLAPQPPRRKVLWAALVGLVLLSVAGYLTVGALSRSSQPGSDTLANQGARGAPAAAPEATAVRRERADAPPGEAKAPDAKPKTRPAKPGPGAAPAASAGRAPPAKSATTSAPNPAKPKGGYAEDLGF